MSEYNCVICNEPVSLNETKADENGQCVHGDCYAKKLTGQVQPVQPRGRFPTTDRELKNPPVADYSIGLIASGFEFA